MIRQFITGRVYVFVDAANILYSQQTLGWRVDYAKLKAYIAQECDLKEIYFYTGKVGDNYKQQSFLKKLESIGYRVRSKEVKRIRVGRNIYEWKGNLDTELIIDVLKNVAHFDTCLILSGDSDFASLLDELKAQHKSVVVMSTKGHISRELLERAKYVNIKKLKEYIEYTGLKIKNPSETEGGLT